MKFDMSDPLVRWQLYRYNNKRHDGEIWLVVRRGQGMYLVEQNDCLPKVEVLGEVRTRFIDGNYVHDIIPFQQRSPAELARLHEQAMEHRRYRAELYKSYSLAERLADLAGKDKPN